MKSLLFLIILSSSAVIFAEGNKPTQYQMMDLKQFDKVTAPAKSNVQFAVTCKTDDGREIKSTDAAYSDCLSKAQSKAQTK